MNNFQIIKGNAEEIIPNIKEKIDIFTALESFEHIPEYLVPEILRSISAKDPKFLACSVPVEVDLLYGSKILDLNLWVIKDIKNINGLIHFGQAYINLIRYHLLVLDIKDLTGDG